MNLPIPIPGVDPGPQYALDLNSSLTIIDQHNHSIGSGVQITPSGININSALSLNGNDLINVASVTLTPQVSTPISGSLYESGVDLFYIDGNGNNIRITQAGSVTGSSGTITGLPSGTASASYGSGVFVFQAATNTAANMDGASFIFRNNIANSKGLTLSPPNAMGSDYQLFLPTIPAQTNIMVIDSSGNMGSVVPFTIAVPTGMITAYGATAAPSGWYLCNGDSLLRTDFPALFSIVGTSFGSADSTHFNVPDLRGTFIRGVDEGAGRDPDTSVRTAMNPGGNTGDNVGSVQNSIYGLHAHSSITDGTSAYRTQSGWASGATYDGIAKNGASPGADVGTSGSGGNETRPINAYLVYIIKT